MTPEDRERLVRIEVNTTETLKKMEDHEERIRILEKTSWWTGGVIAVLFIAFETIKEKVFKQ